MKVSRQPLESIIAACSRNRNSGAEALPPDLFDIVARVCPYRNDEEFQMEIKFSVSGIPPALMLVLFDWLLGALVPGNRFELLAITLLVIGRWSRGKS